MSLDLYSFLSGLYLALLVVLGLFGAHRSWMLARFRWRKGGRLGGRLDASDLPVVTVQLPLYNERTVAARLIRAVGGLDYPRDRLEIQVLDDSSDETRAIADAEVGELQRRGIDAFVLRRPRRDGFKAGALAHGLARARGEFVAVFDADFMPRRDFLRRLLPAFSDPRVGMVQARWEHRNRDESLLTRAQAALLDGHFVIEHTVRYDNGLFFNFNGTAGIWRRRAIEEAGGWQNDTLTEDLDLSYRAQLAGWRFVYAHRITAPAELPAEVSAFRTQQQRWAKGSVQVARKLAGRIVHAEQPLRIKVEAAAHLLGNTGYPFVVALAILLPLVATAGIGGAAGALSAWWHLAAFAACTLSVILFYERGQRALGRTALQRLVDVPAAMALGIGLSVALCRAVLSGAFRSTGEFVRTPKRGDAPAAIRYRALLGGLPWLELLFTAWYGWGLTRAVLAGLWGTLPFLALFFVGFAWVGGLSWREWSRARREPAASLGSDQEKNLLAGEGSPG